MAIYTDDAYAVDDVLRIIERPAASFQRLPLRTQILLGLFMAFYLPSAYILGILWEIVWRTPIRYIRRRREVDMPGSDSWLWQRIWHSSPRGRVILLLLRSEIPEPQTDLSADEKTLRMKRSTYAVHYEYTAGEV